MAKKKKNSNLKPLEFVVHNLFNISLKSSSIVNHFFRIFFLVFIGMLRGPECELCVWNFGLIFKVILFVWTSFLFWIKYIYFFKYKIKGKYLFKFYNKWRWCQEVYGVNVICKLIFIIYNFFCWFAWHVSDL